MNKERDIPHVEIRRTDERKILDMDLREGITPAAKFLREALVNFVALLGWNPGDEREIFQLDELVREFSLERVGKSGAIFNQEKLAWLNEQHLRRRTDAELLPMLRAELAASPFAGGSYADTYLLRVIPAMRERVSFPRDFIEKGAYFFEPPGSYDPEMTKKRWTADAPGRVARLAEAFAALSDESPAAFEQALQAIALELGTSNGSLIHPVRLAVSGVSGGPGIYDILSILGKEESVRRLRRAAERIPAPTA